MTAERHPAVVRDLLLVDGGTPSGHEVDDPADLARRLAAAAVGARRQKMSYFRRPHPDKVVRRQQIALGCGQDARVHKAELEARRATFAEDKTIYEDLRAAFGKNGVPAMIIEAAIPELEDATRGVPASTYRPRQQGLRLPVSRSSM